jgi:DNA transformation protein
MSEGFIEFVLEQLVDLGPIRARSMFGGHGLYQGDIFFGVVYEDRLFFKTDDRSRERYVDSGMGPFNRTRNRRSRVITKCRET